MTHEDDLRNLAALVHQSCRQAALDEQQHPEMTQAESDELVAGYLIRYAASHGLMICRDDGTPL